MNIIPKGSAAAPAAAPEPTQVKQMTTRERAIQTLLGNTGQSPVKNPTNVSPEESGAIRAQIQKPSIEETTSEAPVETKAEEEPLSSQYATLARKEKAIRQREQLLKSKEAELKSKEASFKQPSAPSIDESKYVSREKLAQDPFTVLTEMGLTYDQLTELALNGPKPQEVAVMSELKALREELKSLRGETESTKKSFEDQQTQSYKQAVDQIRAEARQLVRNNPEFETIKETNSISDVVELIEESFKQTGVLMSVEEAAKEVEEYLLDEALKIAKIKKIQQRLAPKATPVEASRTTNAKQELKTLTNSVGSNRRLSAKERALLAFEGKLNK